MPRDEIRAAASSLAIAAVFLGTSAAHAQSTTAGSDSAVEDIIVTAEKRSESLQNTPLAITAVDARQLKTQNINNLEDLTHSVPSLQFGTAATNAYGAQISIRAIGSNSQSGNTDPGVAVSVNGVYSGRTSASVASLFDIERIEVLRGPQGTLYGRNATGGAINIIPHKPVDRYEAQFEASIGNYDLARFRTILNAPLGGDLSFRVAGERETRSGYTKNLVAGMPAQDDADNWSVRPSLYFNNSGPFTALLTGFYTHIKQNGTGTRFLGTDGGSNGYPAAPVLVAGGPPASVVSAFVFQTLGPGWTLQPLPSDLHEVRKNTPDYINVTQYGTDLTLEMELSQNVLLRSITAYQHSGYDMLLDVDSSELNYSTNQMNQGEHQFTQEVNILGNGEHVNWVVGGFYLSGQSQEKFNIIFCPDFCLSSNGYPGPYLSAPPGPPGPPVVLPGSSLDVGSIHHTFSVFKSKAYAAFGQATWKATEKLSLTAGMRYSHDDKWLGSRSLADDFKPYTSTPAFSDALVQFASHGFGQITWRGAVDYRFSDDAMIYSSVSRGYKSGGVQLAASSSLGFFDPETVTTYEVGARLRGLEDRIQFNATGYYSDYKNYQTFELTINGPLTINADSARIQGLEFDAKVIPVSNLHVDASASIIDSRYTDFKTLTEDFTGHRLNRAPVFAGDVSARYDIRTSWGRITPNVGYSYTGAQYFDRANTPFDRQKAYGLLRASLNFEVGDYSLLFWANNITDTQYIASEVINPPFSGASRLIKVGTPATFGATFHANF